MSPSPYLQDSDFTLYCGDAREVLSTLPAESVHMAVTSPPFHSLRDYGHPDQIGLEPTVDEWIGELVKVFRECRRVLRNDGTLWIEIGDSYSDKQLVGQPWRLAEALKAPHYTGRIKDAHDRIWLAAMVDAEGCIHIHKRKAGDRSYSKFRKADGTDVEYRRKNDTYGVMVSVDNTNEAVIARCAEIVGQGSRYKDEAGSGKQQRKQTLYRWTVTGQQARALLRELYPHLVAKQREARIAFHCDSKLGSEAQEAIKDLHNGRATGFDSAPPPTLFEPGMYLRNVCIFHRPNPMPESVRDRFTVSHSYVLLFSKSPRYFFDAESVREAYNPDGRKVTTVQQGENSIQHRNGERWPERPQTKRARELFDQHGLTDAHLTAIKAVGMNDAGKAQVNQDGYGKNDPEQQRLADEAKDALGGYYREFLLPPGGRNARSVWTIATEPLPFEHYAAFPQALAERCIKAGTSERGCCPECGAPWVREIEVESQQHRSNWSGSNRGNGVVSGGGHFGRHGAFDSTTTTLGWSPSCECNAGDPIPASVIDCFLGSGTTALVSRRLGRRCVGVELSPKYAELAAKRTQQLSLLGDESPVLASAGKEGAL